MHYILIWQFYEKIAVLYYITGLINMPSRYFKSQAWTAQQLIAQSKQVIGSWIRKIKL